MKKISIVACAALALSVIASPTYASNAKLPGKGEICHERSNDDACANAHKHKAKKDKKAHHEVPEIDGASAGLALALMGGIVALRRERRKQQA